VSESWTIKDFVAGLSRALNWNNKQQNEIKLVHLEGLKNGRKHIRMTFYKQEMIADIEIAGRATRDINLKSLNINGTTVLFEIMNNLMERFKIVPMRKKASATKSSTILVNFNYKDTFKDIINKIEFANIKSFKYLSLLKSDAFISFLSQKDCDKFIQILHSQNYRVNYSHTFLNLLKFNHALTEGRNLIPSDNVDLRRKIPKRNDNDVKNEDSGKLICKKLDEMTHRLEKVVEAQNNNVNNVETQARSQMMPYDMSIFNNNSHLFPANMSAFDRNMQMAALQFPNMNINVPLIQGIVRMRNMLSNNPFF
jgi:hypothetical protein